MVKVGLIEYFTTPTRTLIFLAKEGISQPLVFEAKTGEGSTLTSEYLRLCADRLIVDFHGLPKNWDAPGSRERFRRIGSLPPRVNMVKRTDQIQEINLHRPAYAYDLTYWESLSDALLPRDLRTQIADCQLLCFVPHGPLHELPFSALRWSPQEYLVERFGVCQIPSVTVLRYCRKKNQRRELGGTYRPTRCLVAAIGTSDPGDDVQDFEADSDVMRELFLQVDPQNTVTCLVGYKRSSTSDPASKQMIIEQCPNQHVIHLACHGVFGLDTNSKDPLDSALLVSDGVTAPTLQGVADVSLPERANHMITAREVLGLQLTAELVTLRACSSGRAALQQGDEIVGLTRAFLYAGTASMLVSLWNVNKRSSRRLLNDFYRLWLAPRQFVPKWAALREAQLQMLRGGDYSHPYHWAPFILVGDWL